METTIKRLRKMNWVVTASCATVSTGVWLVFRNSLPPQLPLFYGKPWGEPQLGGANTILILPIMAVCVGLATGLLSKITKDQVLECIVVASGLVTQLILALAMLRIILLVI